MPGVTKNPRMVARFLQLPKKGPRFGARPEFHEVDIAGCFDIQLGKVTVEVRDGKVIVRTEHRLLVQPDAANQITIVPIDPRETSRTKLSNK